MGVAALPGQLSMWAAHLHGQQKAATSCCHGSRDAPQDMSCDMRVLQPDPIFPFITMAFPMNRIETYRDENDKLENGWLEHELSSGKTKLTACGG